MSRTVLLDASPLGLATNPKLSAESMACTQWVQSLIRFRHRVVIPEIADYEVRRELLRAGKKKSIAELNRLATAVEYLAITTTAIRKAAEFWAEARRQGKPTAPEHAIDADAILAGQAATLGVSDFVVATTNVAHLSRFVPAELWGDIKP